MRLTDQGRSQMTPVGRDEELAASERLARARFEQSAIFWFDGGAFWLVGALVDAKARQLP